MARVDESQRAASNSVYARCQRAAPTGDAPHLFVKFGDCHVPAVWHNRSLCLALPLFEASHEVAGHWEREVDVHGGAAGQGCGLPREVVVTRLLAWGVAERHGQVGVWIDACKWRASLHCQTTGQMTFQK